MFTTINSDVDITATTHIVLSALEAGLAHDHAQLDTQLQLLRPIATRQTGTLLLACMAVGSFAVNVHAQYLGELTVEAAVDAACLGHVSEQGLSHAQSEVLMSAVWDLSLGDVHLAGAVLSDESAWADGWKVILAFTAGLLMLQGRSMGVPPAWLVAQLRARLKVAVAGLAILEDAFLIAQAG